jgi:hypothetical protein
LNLGTWKRAEAGVARKSNIQGLAQANPGCHHALVYLMLTFSSVYGLMVLPALATSGTVLWLIPTTASDECQEMPRLISAI